MSRAPTPKRLALIEAMRARLLRITTANGFATDAGRMVFTHERPQLGPDDVGVAVAMLIGDDEPGWQGKKLVLGVPIEIHAMAHANLEAPWIAAEAVLGDIKTAVESADRTIPGITAGPMERRPTRVVPRDAGSFTVGVAITYLCPITETWGRPDL